MSCVQVIRCKHKIRSFSEMLHPRKGQLSGLAIALANNMLEVGGHHSAKSADTYFLSASPLAAPVPSFQSATFRQPIPGMQLNAQVELHSARHLKLLKQICTSFAGTVL